MVDLILGKGVFVCGDVQYLVLVWIKNIAYLMKYENIYR